MRELMKTAEERALEAYPILFSERNGYDNTFKDRRESYIKGYDQAVQDFEEWLQDQFHIHPHDCHVVQYESDTTLNSIDDLVEQFKKYINSE